MEKYQKFFDEKVKHQNELIESIWGVLEKFCNKKIVNESFLTNEEACLLYFIILFEAEKKFDEKKYSDAYELAVHAKVVYEKQNIRQVNYHSVFEKYNDGFVQEYGKGMNEAVELNVVNLQEYVMLENAQKLLEQNTVAEVVDPVSELTEFLLEKGSFSGKSKDEISSLMNEIGNTESGAMEIGFMMANTIEESLNKAVLKVIEPHDISEMNKEDIAYIKIKIIEALENACNEANTSEHELTKLIFSGIKTGLSFQLKLGNADINALSQKYDEKILESVEITSSDEETMSMK